jgi:hypothetical protein
VKISALNILDFDCETRPVTYTGWGTTDEITAIAASWYGSKEVSFFHLPAGMSTDQQFLDAGVEMLSAFVQMYNAADIVTGHYIRNFDLLKLNGALINHDLPILSSKMTICTKNDLVKFNGLSKSQENLGQLLGKFNSKEYLGRKEHCSQMDWQHINHLTVEGIEDNKRRVTGDVRQHKEMRIALVEANLLKSPKVWRP